MRLVRRHASSPDHHLQPDDGDWTNEGLKYTRAARKKKHCCSTVKSKLPLQCPILPTLLRTHPTRIVATLSLLLGVGWMFFAQIYSLRRNLSTLPRVRNTVRSIGNKARSNAIHNNDTVSQQVVKPELLDVIPYSTQALQQFQRAHLSPLAKADYTHFTVRINTWQREEQLKLAIAHYTTCRSVALLQVVWCIDQGPVPSWLLDWQQHGPSVEPQVVVERQAVNSLNARFAVQQLPPTATLTRGILSTDDDVIRPCIALEAGFATWLRNPDRQVGYDARSHGMNANDHKWTYAYMSTTEQTNAYSLTLTRHSFQHVDYLHSYTNEMSSSIREFVAQHLNCEDIAMSLWISSRTNGQPPLLADAWAVKSQLKLYVDHKISGGQSHKAIRDECVDSFATTLQLKDRLAWTRLRHDHDAYFAYGAVPTNWNEEAVQTVWKGKSAHSWYGEWTETLERWRSSAESNERWLSELADLRRQAAQPMFDQGMIENTSPWKKRFRPRHKS
jgi:glucuronyl/N-acetylglucosaminyl transferase EXT2